MVPNFMRAYTKADSLRERLRQAKEIKKICSAAGLQLTPFGTTFEGPDIYVHYSYIFDRLLEMGRRNLDEYGRGLMITCEWSAPEWDIVVGKIREYVKSTSALSVCAK